MQIIEPARNPQSLKKFSKMNQVSIIIVLLVATWATITVNGGYPAEEINTWEKFKVVFLLTKPNDIMTN